MRCSFSRLAGRLLCLMAVAASLAALSGCDGDSSELGPRLLVNRRIQVGEGRIGDTVKSAIVFRNAGGTVLNVKRVRTSCGCGSVEPEPPFAISPGEEKEVSVQFRIGGRKREHVEKVFIETDDPSMRIATVDLIAVVTEGLFARPSVIDFGITPMGEVKQQSLQILSWGGELRSNREGVQVISDAPWLKVEEDEESDGAAYVVALGKDAPLGRHTPTLIVRDNNIGEEVSVPVHVDLRRLVMVVPSAITIAEEDIVSKQPMRFVIKRLDGGSLGRFAGFSGPSDLTVFSVRQEPESPDIACVVLRFSAESPSVDWRQTEQVAFAFDACPSDGLASIITYRSNSQEASNEAVKGGLHEDDD